MKISLEEIKALQKMSAIEFSEEKLQVLLKDFNEIKEFLDQVKLVQVDESLEYRTILDIEDLRPDIKVESMAQKVVIQNAPEKNESAFLVPKVVE